MMKILLIGLILVSTTAFAAPRTCEELFNKTSFRKTIEAKSARASVEAIYEAHGSGDRSDLPSINSGELIGLRRLSNVSGLNHRGIFEATYRGRHVLVKFLKPAEETEGYWYTYLNKIGLGAKFYGLTRMNVLHTEYSYETHDDVRVRKPSYAVVIDFVEGPESKDLLGQQISITEADVQAMRSQYDQLDRAEIVPDDIAFIMSSRGPVLIDTGWYHPKPQAGSGREGVAPLAREHFENWIQVLRDAGLVRP